MWLHKQTKNELDKAVQHIRTAQKLQDELIIFIKQQDHHRPL